jgi:hypothetical protein
MVFTNVSVSLWSSTLAFQIRAKKCQKERAAEEDRVFCELAPSPNPK